MLAACCGRSQLLTMRLSSLAARVLCHSSIPPHVHGLCRVAKQRPLRQRLPTTCGPPLYQAPPRAISPGTQASPTQPRMARSTAHRDNCRPCRADAFPRKGPWQITLSCHEAAAIICTTAHNAACRSPLRAAEKDSRVDTKRCAPMSLPSSTTVPPSPPAQERHGTEANARGRKSRPHRAGACQPAAALRVRPIKMPPLRELRHAFESLLITPAAGNLRLVRPGQG